MGVKVIKDLVHGYISIDEDIQRCIDTSYFQRLHRVKQLTCTLLFPSVNHTRYEHSLGVMKLACDFFETLNPMLKIKGKTQCELENLKNHLRFAALLHDVGHPAFSHLGEKFLEKDEIYKEICKITEENFRNNLKSVFFNNDIIQGSPHELMSCYCILKPFKKYLPENMNLYFLCRMIIGNHYTDEKKWAENICIQILNSPSIDVDKLDYLMRDNYMTGKIAPFMDIERLLASLSIDKENKLCFIAKALPAVQSVVDSRDSLYLWVYHHHISIYTDFLLGEMLNVSIEKGLLDRKRFFSPAAVAENLIADDDVYSYLRGIYIEKRDSDAKEEYLTILSQQFFERKFLKALWKTIYEYHDLAQEWKEKKYIPDVERLNVFLKNEEKMKELTDRIRRDIGVREGEIFLISQHHKFYHSVKKIHFEIVLKGKKRLLSELLPQKNFGKFHNLSFFFYIREDKKEAAYKSFLRNISQMIKNI